MKKTISTLLALLMLLTIFCLPACAASAPFSVPKGCSYNAKTKTLSGEYDAGSGPLDFPTFSKLDFSKNWISDPVAKKNAILVNSASYGWALADPIKNGQIKKVYYTDSEYSEVITRNSKNQVIKIEPDSDRSHSLTEYSYNAQGQISEMVEIPSHGPDLTTYTFSYDPNGRLVSYQTITGDQDDEDPALLPTEKHTFTYQSNTVTETIQSSEGTKTVTHNL